MAKIADFGLARPGPSDGREYTTIKTRVVFGTKAYLAPEFRSDLKRKLSTRLDVYSFGVVSGTCGLSLLSISVGSRTTPHRIKIKPYFYPTRPLSLGLLFTRITPHQNHYQPVKPLIKTNTCMVGNCPGGELSRYDLCHYHDDSRCGKGNSSIYLISSDCFG